jgi:tetratricopeptide (TPR) repeat protein
MRRVESNACRREILGRQENLLRQIMAETDGMLAMIEERGELGDFSKCRGLNRYSPLDDSIYGMGRGLFAAGRIEEALQRMERAIALIRSVQKDEDLEAVAFILNGYADLLDRSSQIEKALPIYREAPEIWCHLKQREDPSVKRRAVRVKDVRRHSQAYRKGIGVGDVILSYDGDLLFDPRQLINRTIRDEDDPGEVVTLELLKNGEIEERVVLTGRLGVTLEPCWLAESESARRERQVDAHEETDLAHSGDPVGAMAEHGEISR